MKNIIKKQKITWTSDVQVTGMKNKYKQIIFYVLGAFLVVGGVVLADIINKLIPTENTSTPNFVTLSDIYNRITVGTAQSNHTNISTSSSPLSSMYTLSEIYNAIPSFLSGNTSNATSTRTDTILTLTIPRGISDGTATLSTTSADLIAGNILTSKSIFGVAGNIALPVEGDVRKDTVYGPSNSLTGGLEVSSNPAPLVWSAHASAGLCWDASRTCSVGSGFLELPTSGDVVGAVEYCTHLNTAGTTLTSSIGPWSLPTEAQLMSALAMQFMPGATGGAFRASTNYWSLSENGSNYAWNGNGSNGHLYSSIDGKSNQRSVMCVR